LLFRHKAGTAHKHMQQHLLINTLRARVRYICTLKLA